MKRSYTYHNFINDLNEHIEEYYFLVKSQKDIHRKTYLLMQRMRNPQHSREYIIYYILFRKKYFYERLV